MSDRETRPTGWIVWSAVIQGSALVLAFLVPLRLVMDPSRPALSLGWESTLTLLYAADLFVQRRVRQGSSGIWLALDAAAVLPLALIPGFQAAALLRLTKLLGAIPLLLTVWRSVVVHPTVLRLSVFVFVMAVTTHWLACGWLWLDGPGIAGSAGGDYLQALYWCVTTLTTVGYGDVTPATGGQTVYAMMVMLLGVGLYGFVIGNLATLLTRMDMVRAQYVATLERLSEFLRYRRIPADLQRQIFDYHRYLWERRMGYDEAAVLKDLPPTLRRKLALVMRGDLIEKISFLHGASRELVLDLSRKLRPVVFMPGDVIVRAGEHGHHVYFISSGSAQVFDEQGNHIRDLSDGDFFGELALLHGLRRTATVRAEGYCDLYALDREDFEKTLHDYPDFASEIERVAAERLKESGGESVTGAG